MGIFNKKRKKAEKHKAEYDTDHPQLPRETRYLHEVGKLMQEFATAGKSVEEKHQALSKATAERKQKTEEFIQEQFPGFEVVGHVNITRHGKSGAKEKGLGFSVNAPLSKKQIKGLKDAKTNDFTHHLLHAPDKTLTVIGSTLLRAKNTMSSMIPTKSKVVKVSTDQRLTEHGHWASTAAYTQTAGKGKPWWVFASIFTRSTLRNRTRESKAVDQELLAIRERSKDTNLELHGGYINEPNKDTKAIVGDPHSSPVIREQEEQDISSLSVENKIASINNSIINHVSQEDPTNRSSKHPSQLESHIDPHPSVNPDKGDLWLFGHGGTFKKFFHSTFGLEYNFDYLTTKEIYVLKGPDGKLVYFSPPGAVKVGVDGEMTGLTTDHNGVQDRALVSLGFDRAELVIDCSKQLTEEVKKLQQEVASEDRPKDIAALEKRLTAAQAKVEAVEKNIEICDQELSQAKKTKPAAYVDAVSNVKSIKNNLAAMKTNINKLVSAKEEVKPENAERQQLRP